MSIETGFALLGLVVAGVLYVIRAEIKGDVTRIDGRINTHEKGCEVRQGFIAGELASIKEHGQRMEDKLDRLLQDR